MVGYESKCTAAAGFRGSDQSQVDRTHNYCEVRKESECGKRIKRVRRGRRGRGESGEGGRAGWVHVLEAIVAEMENAQCGRMVELEGSWKLSRFVVDVVQLENAELHSR